MAGREIEAFQRFIVKIHGRCNLACDYCYVYEHADQSWRTRPRAMSPAVIQMTADRIGEHARVHGLPRVSVALHGGEPLLAGRETIGFAVRSVRAAVPAGTAVEVSLQTNGVLLDRDFLELCRRQEVLVGVSLDGGEQAHDRHRRQANGAGSFARVASALAELATEPNREIYGGLLCTVDLRNDPVAVYEDLVRFGPPRINFLLPHGNWHNPPDGRAADQSSTPYGDWLSAAFDRWYRGPVKETRVLLFDAIIALLLGAPGGTEMIGWTPSDAIVIETDGSIEHNDALKTTAPGLGATGLTVQHHALDLALDGRPQTTVLAAQCLACPVVRVCGGGLYAHRYHPRNGFDNPSVYCADLAKLIGHIRATLVGDIAKLRGAAMPAP